mmetsp:Transcript_7837/g.12233  ORF Transcript_7837/g.12233 Transcript_7837/m.12233 type:complete len:143 (-) Transcript_7837:148-576(-)
MVVFDCAEISKEATALFTPWLPQLYQRNNYRCTRVQAKRAPPPAPPASSNTGLRLHTSSDGHRTRRSSLPSSSDLPAAAAAPEVVHVWHCLTGFFFLRLVAVALRLADPVRGPLKPLVIAEEEEGNSSDAGSTHMPSGTGNL